MKNRKTFDPLASNAFDLCRARGTVEFLKYKEIKHPVLDIGPKSEMTTYLMKDLDIDTISNTYGDLDNGWWKYDYGFGRFKTVFCFEVIEHLLNPKNFLKGVYCQASKDVNLYLSFPQRPKYLWNNDLHFHEYDSMRFRYLLDQTGWGIVDIKKIYVLNLKYLHTGIRPWIRLFYPQTVVYHLKKTGY